VNARPDTDLLKSDRRSAEKSKVNTEHAAGNTTTHSIMKETRRLRQNSTQVCDLAMRQPGKRSSAMEASQQPVKYNGDSGSKKTSIRVGAVIALALLAGFVAWIVIDRTGNDSATTTQTTTTTTPTTSAVGPVAAPAKVLSALVANVGHTVYWAGPIAGETPEFTRTTIDRVYVRYLPKGVDVGDKRSDFLIIATYPFLNAYAALKKAAKGSEVKIPGGGIALVSKTNPKSVAFAFPKAAYQGEVYDPSPKKALRVATSGTLRPVP
jgi:hypothetical protein